MEVGEPFASQTELLNTGLRGDSFLFFLPHWLLQEPVEFTWGAVRMVGPHLHSCDSYGPAGVVWKLESDCFSPGRAPDPLGIPEDVTQRHGGTGISACDRVSGFSCGWRTHSWPAGGGHEVKGPHLQSAVGPFCVVSREYFSQRPPDFIIFPLWIFLKVLPSTGPWKLASRLVVEATDQKLCRGALIAKFGLGAYLKPEITEWFWRQHRQGSYWRKGLCPLLWPDRVPAGGSGWEGDGTGVSLQEEQVLV